MGFFKQVITEKITLAVILLVIVAAILIFTSQEDQPAASVQSPAETVTAVPENESGFTALEKQLEEKLAANLEKIQGVGKTKVLVTLTSDVKKQYARDESVTKKTSKETDKDGGTRETEEVTQNNKIVVVGENALIITEERPQVAGVLVIAQGASDPKIKEQVFEAVRTLLNIEPAKISVVPMGGV
ncbi:MAG: stage III sporulation protein AG [Dehalobacter sp. 4CP]|uniref:stage III sporulation protein AG n=1 Tax=Dehalobacter sp. CP TaxID=2594474 RepID=UPI0013C66950|nr:stage III sporulation protein AG [Dehalobacter sp.]NBJ14990.1 stage III sporulation protein AG [Dehalobacter sp. 4CP]